MKKFNKAIIFILTAALLAGIMPFSFAITLTGEVPDYYPLYGLDFAAIGRQQGIVVPSNLNYSQKFEYYTFYSTDYDHGILKKSQPEDYRKYDAGRVTLPFNGYLLASEGNYYLIYDCDGNIFWMNKPVTGKIKIDYSVESDDYSAILDLARGQGIVIPQGFRITQTVCGKMYNDKSEIYAIYMFADPTRTDASDRFGTFCFENPTNPSTVNYNGWVTIYGYYNGRGLMEHNGQFFWGTDKFLTR